MKNLLLKIAIPLALTGPALLGCGPSGTTVKRGGSGQDLSGEWNSVDADEVAKIMIKEMFAQAWLTKFKSEHGKNPTIKLYPIKNRSSDHVETKYFTKQVEGAMVNGGEVDVVAAKDEVSDIRDEQADQGKHASDETMKSAGNESGADFILNGWIVSQNDSDGNGKTIKAFVTTMELTNIQSGKKVWLKDHKIVKEVQRSGASF